MSNLISQVADWQQYLATTLVHPTLLPFPILDVLGAMRLSMVVDQISRAAASSTGPGGAKKARSTGLQEAFGILVVVFGGETFLACCTNTTPSWLLSPATGALFAGTHLLLTRTPISALLPAKPSLAIELPLALHDALGRALLLTSATVLPLTSYTSPAKSLNPLSSTKLSGNPTAMMLVPFISTTPFPMAVFGWDWFTATPKIQTPPELRAGGWKTVDFWAPVTIAYIYAFLIHAHPAFLAPYDLVRWAIRNSTAFTAFLMDAFGSDNGKQLPLWVYGHEPWSPRDATALCAIILTVLFGLRAIYNFGGNPWIGGEASPLSSAEKEKMDRSLGLEPKANEKIATGQSSGVAWPPRASTPIKKHKSKAA